MPPHGTPTPESTRQRHVPVPPPARRQSGGTGGSGATRPLPKPMRLDRPVLLSVGYAACHWCHVMAHESFEDPATADVMNRLFVNIKVDREERPDVDRIYMDAVQAATGRGGWPMTVFLTPDRRARSTPAPTSPRRTGTGLPGFTRVLEAVADAWEHRREEIAEQAQRLTAAVRDRPARRRRGTRVRDALRSRLPDARDPATTRPHGGFGGAPKFPQAPTLEFLLRIAGEDVGTPGRRDAGAHPVSMAAGGIYDHLGGGFARYSVDSAGWSPTSRRCSTTTPCWPGSTCGRPRSPATTTSPGSPVRHSTTCSTDLRLPEGGFASAEDADSEGEEGRFYVFTLDEVEEAVGEHAPVAAAVLRGHRGRQLRGLQRAAPAGDAPEAVAAALGIDARSGLDLDRRGQAPAAGRPLRAHPPGPGRQGRSAPGTPWRSGPSPRQEPSSTSNATWTQPSPRHGSSSTSCGTPRDGCSDPGGKGGPRARVRRRLRSHRRCALHPVSGHRRRRAGTAKRS